MQILYLGLPLGALHLLAHDHRPALVLLGPGDAPGRRRLRQRMGEALLEAPDLEEAGVRRRIEAAQPDLLLSFFWPRRVPTWLLERPRLGAYGTHPSLLPRHRGPDPYFWTLRDGDATSGVTLHRLEPEYDTGAVIAQRTLPVDAMDDAWKLARRLDKPALELLVWAAETLSEGQPLAGQPQTEATGRWARRPTEEDLRLDWHSSTRELLQLVRAAAPWPGASARLGSHGVEVVRAEAATLPPPRALVPAEAYDHAGEVAVVCGDGALVLTRVREGDRQLTTEEVRARVRPKTNAP